MKKIVIVIAVLACAAFFAVVSHAWDVPKNAGDLANTGGKIGLQTALNKKLTENKCAFKAGTADTTCDLGKVGKELSAAAGGSKVSGKYDIYVYIEADDAVAKGNKSASLSGTDRANKVNDQLQSGLASAAGKWHYNTKSSNAKGNNLKISVEVK